MKKEKIKMECYHTVYTEGTGEIVEKKSRFIATIRKCENEEEAVCAFGRNPKKTLGCQTSLLGICNRKKSGGRENER